MSAQARGWGPGWPTDRRRDMVVIRAPLSGATFPGGVHEGIAGLAVTLLDATERRGYRCVPGWCWGYNNRPIGGTRKPSNHSWGLALDVNAPRNPYGSRLVTDMPSWLPAMWKDCGFGWGGDYRTNKDAMHLEYLRRPQDVAGDLARARAYLSGAGGTQAAEEDDVLKEGDSGGEVVVLQWRTNQFLHGEADPRRAGKNYGLVVDGNYGSSTKAYIAEVQKRLGYKTSGIYNMPTALRIQERLIQMGIIKAA